MGPGQPRRAGGPARRGGEAARARGGEASPGRRALHQRSRAGRLRDAAAGWPGLREAPLRAALLHGGSAGRHARLPGKRKAHVPGPLTPAGRADGKAEGCKHGRQTGGRPMDERARDDVVLVSAVRTPVGRYGGALKDVRPDDLAALAIAEAVRRAGVGRDAIEDVVLGCANQAGEDNRNVARMALLLAGLPVEVAGQTVNRLCGSGLQAVVTAANAIRVGAGDTFVAGGVESMTRAPFVLGKAENAFGRDMQLQDTTLGWRFINT